ncbi:MAG: BON domain-containing protein [Parachlamydia sp.]|nr:BON domain-containing protein [Parachlamydia sp.]
MENYRKVAVSALFGVVSFASLVAYDNYSQGAYNQQGGNLVRGQDSSYQQSGSPAGYYQDGSQGNQQGYQNQGYQNQGGYQGQQGGYYQGDSQTSGQQYSVDIQTQHHAVDSNEAVGQRVLSALQKEPTLSTPRNVQVTAFDGKITLTGTVKSEDEKSKVESIAKQVSGVKSVINNINVRK